MCTDRAVARQRGITLIELLVFIIIISVGIAGILSVMNVVVKSSADPVVHKQAAAMAEAILEEIMSKDFAPNAGYPQPAADTCPARMLADDVDDYANCNGAAFIAGNDTLGADALAGLAAYRATVAVGAAAAVDGVPMKQITVTVAGPASFSLSGYKAGY